MSIKIVGVEELQAKLKKNVRMDDVKRVVQQNGSELQSKAQNYAPVDTGTLKLSIGLNITDGGLTAKSEATAEYAPYQEWGTRYMEAQPYMKPAFNDQKHQFKSDMKRLTE